MASRIEVRRRADTKRDARAAGVEEDLGKRRARGQGRRAKDDAHRARGHQQPRRAAAESKGRKFEQQHRQRRERQRFDIVMAQNRVRRVLAVEEDQRKHHRAHRHEQRNAWELRLAAQRGRSVQQACRADCQKNGQDHRKRRAEREHQRAHRRADQGKAAEHHQQDRERRAVKGEVEVHAAAHATYTNP